MTRLSVNINKVATLRNARGGNIPDVGAFAQTCLRLGADGITVHPRPDERHIRRNDVLIISQIFQDLTGDHVPHAEFNIEGNPEPPFMDLVCAVHPTQVTLVPDGHEQLTSNHGWDTLQYQAHLSPIIERLHDTGIRVSIFVDPDPEMVEGAKDIGADRVELYTGPYAELYTKDPDAAIAMYRSAAEKANAIGLGMNAGHDLNTHNLRSFVQAFPWTDEVSIGQALIADALYYGIEQTIKLYKDALTN